MTHTEFLEHQLTNAVATLQSEGLVEMKRIAQDGMRIRASAGAASFRRRPTLEQCLAEAEEQLAVLRQELEVDLGAASRREKAARARAVQERKERIESALEQLPEVETTKKATDTI